jgi:hypothetical protein
MTGKEAYQIYGDAVGKMVEALGGKIRFSGDVTGLMLGEVEDLWDMVALAEYPSLAAFRAMHELLTPDGYLAFDVFSPTPADITATHRVWHHRDSGAKERADWNRPDGTTHVEVEMRGRTTTLVLHPLPAQRWLELVEEAGFEVITTWGGFDGEKVRGDGTKLHAWCAPSSSTYASRGARGGCAAQGNLNVCLQHCGSESLAATRIDIEPSLAGAVSSVALSHVASYSHRTQLSTPPFSHANDARRQFLDVLALRHVPPQSRLRICNHAFALLSAGLLIALLYGLSYSLYTEVHALPPPSYYYNHL